MLYLFRIPTERNIRVCSSHEKERVYIIGEKYDRKGYYVLRENMREIRIFVWNSTKDDWVELL